MKSYFQIMIVVLLCSTSCISQKAILSIADLINNFVNKILPEDGSSQNWLAATDYHNFLDGKTINRVDVLTRTGISQNHSASILGAAEKINYFDSLSHVDNHRTLIGNDYSCQTAVLSLQNDVKNWFQFGVKSNFTYNNYDGVQKDVSPHKSSFKNAYRPNGELDKYLSEVGVNYINPLWNTFKTNGTIDDYERFSSTDTIGHLLIKVLRLKELSYRFNAAYSHENFKRDFFENKLFFIIEGTGEVRYLASKLTDL